MFSATKSNIETGFSAYTFVTSTAHVNLPRIYRHKTTGHTNYRILQKSNTKMNIIYSSGRILFRIKIKTSVAKYLE